MTCMHLRLVPASECEQLALADDGSLQVGSTWGGRAHDIANASLGLQAAGDMQKCLTCGICKSLVASSLVLSCGHMFCGACLFDFVNERCSCPTCQVGDSPLFEWPVMSASIVLGKERLGA